MQISAHERATRPAHDGRQRERRLLLEGPSAGVAPKIAYTNIGTIVLMCIKTHQIRLK